MSLAARFRRFRRNKKLNQNVVAAGLKLSISEVSRMERQLRSIRVGQLQSWARSLGCRVEVLFWEDPKGEAPFDDKELEFLQEVAAAVRSLPQPARRALIQQMRIWRLAA